MTGILDQFKQRVKARQDGNGNTQSEQERSAFEYLEQRRQEEERLEAQEATEKDLAEARFLSRVTIAMQYDDMVVHTLDDLRNAAYPEEEIWGFRHWINADSQCPWEIHPDTNEYGIKLDEMRLQFIQWKDYQPPDMRWTIGHYPRGQYGESAWWAFTRKVEILLVVEEGGEPSGFLCTREGPYKPTESNLTKEGLTKALVRLHP